jgi:hypothetical protein
VMAITEWSISGRSIRIGSEMKKHNIGEAMNPEPTFFDEGRQAGHWRARNPPP